MPKAAIISTGRYLPKKVLTNFDLEKMVDTTDEWIRTRTGISERHIAGEDEATSDLAAKAGKDALAKAGMDASELDMIIVATFSPDVYLSSSSCRVQALLGAMNAGCFDIAAACTGFIYGLSIAASYIRTGLAKHVLVVGTEILSRFLDWTDRSTCVLFGDGAGAMIVGPSKGKHELLDFILKADGTGWDLLKIPAGGSRKPPTHETVDNREHTIKMAGREIYKFAVNKLRWLIEEAAKRQGITTKEIDKVIPHQVNFRIVESATERLGLKPEQFFLNLAKYGNTSGASIPIAFDEALAEGFIEDGDLIVLPGFGAGLTYGAAVVRW